MSRAYCYQCHRAKIACLCGRIEKQANLIKIIVLQHPEETANSKGSAIIAEMGLQQYQRWAGEDFKHHTQLNKLLSEEAGKIALLYPAENSKLLDEQWKAREGKDISILVIIDGTWRKARKIWEINPQLHGLPTIRLPEDKKSAYRIRKAPQQGYLSTVECIVAGLRTLESQPEAYQPLIELFTEMVDFQISKMGEKIYLKNYQDK